MARKITRVTVNLNSELVEAVDKYAADMNINRTAAVAVLLSQAVNSQKMMTDIGKLIELAEKHEVE